MPKLKRPSSGRCSISSSHNKLKVRAAALGIRGSSHMTRLDLQASILCKEYEINKDNQPDFWLDLKDLLCLNLTGLKAKTGWHGNPSAGKDRMIREYLNKEAHHYQDPLSESYRPSSPGSPAYLDTDISEDDQMDVQMDVQMNNQMNNQMNDQMNQMDDQMNNDMNQMDDRMNNDMNNQMGNQLDYQSDNQSAYQADYDTDDQEEMVPQRKPGRHSRSLHDEEADKNAGPGSSGGHNTQAESAKKGKGQVSRQQQAGNASLTPLKRAAGRGLSISPPATRRKLNDAQSDDDVIFVKTMPKPLPVRAADPRLFEYLEQCREMTEEELEAFRLDAEARSAAVVCTMLQDEAPF